MADASRDNRPLSPHLSVYKFQPSMATSILNRMTGVGLTLGAVLIVWWFLAASTSPEYFATADAFLNSWFGKLIMIGSLWALSFHFCAGIRHLIWDMGIGIDKAKAQSSSIAVLAGSVVLTVLVLLIA